MKLQALHRLIHLFLCYLIFRNYRVVYYFFLLALCLTLTGCLLPEDIKPAFSENLSLEQAAICNTQLGLYYLKENNIQQARIKLLKANRQAPQLPIVKSAMACFLEHVGEIKASEKNHLQAIGLHQTEGMIHNHYGEFLLRQKRYKEAKSHFLIAVQDLNYLATAHAYENAALCSIKLFENNRARYYLKKALFYNPSLKQARLQLMQLENPKKINFNSFSTTL